jgi:hypothetical protein
MKPDRTGPDENSTAACESDEDQFVRFAALTETESGYMLNALASRTVSINFAACHFN